MDKLFIALAAWAACIGVAAAQQVAPGQAELSQGNVQHMLYVGADYDFMTLQVNTSSASGSIPDGHYFGRLMDFRAGVRVLKAISVEAHVGVNASGSAANHFGFSRYYGVFAVPTATVANTVELSVPIGYVWSGAHARGASTTFNSVAFGANLELPVQTLFPSLPDFRITGGGVVSVQRSNAQIYGFHVGLRYDFGLGLLDHIGL